MKNRLTLLVISLLVLFIFAIFDYFTGVQLLFFVFYFIPISMTSWYVGKKSGIFMSFISTFASFYTDYLQKPEQSYFAYAWNSIAIIFSFLLLTYFIMARKSALRKEKEHTEIDYLTGAKNIRSFLRVFSGELKRSIRQKQPLTLIYLNLDNFRTINDEKGRGIGDLLLHGISNSIIKSIRTSDVLCRTGGDEFALLLPETGYEECNNVINRIRQILMTSSNSLGVQISCSMGSVTHKIPPDNPEFILREAEELMCKSKREGKNRVSKELFE